MTIKITWGFLKKAEVIMKTYCPYRICPLGTRIDHQYGVVIGGTIDLGITLEYEKINSI